MRYLNRDRRSIFIVAPFGRSGLNVQNHLGPPAFATVRHLQPVKRRALYLTLPPVDLEVERSAGEASIEGETFPSGFLDANICADRNKTVALNEEDELVYPAYQEGLQVEGP